MTDFIYAALPLWPHLLIIMVGSIILWRCMP